MKALSRAARRSPYLWLVAAVLVALVALALRGVGLVVVLVAVSVERGALVLAVAAAVADEYVSGRAGLPPLAGELLGGAR